MNPSRPSTDSDTPLAIFCRQIGARSAEHRKAMFLMHGNDLIGQCISILRQELDSMVRVLYLLSLDDITWRDELIRASVDGKEWKRRNGKGRITDAEMLQHAERLQGWARMVYKFGCSFIHLSRYHDYHSRDALENLSNEERRSIREFMDHYHGAHVPHEFSLFDLSPYLFRVFDKISSNLDHYVRDLANGH